MSKRWMIYGANGYTGRLVGELAAHRGLRPVLAGRHEERVAEVATQLNLEHRVFDLGDIEAARRGLEGMSAVLLTAGPFSATSAPMVQACLDTRTHYLDVTGELGVFEEVFFRDEDARRAGIALLPGVGFDVVPTDCLAAMLARELPQAARLEIGIAGLASMSQGTWKSSVEGMARGGFVRRGGRIIPVPAAWRKRVIPFPHKPLTAVTIPWGDVSTAYRSTSIPDIWVYMALPRHMQRILPVADRLKAVLGAPSVQHALKRLVERVVKGPDDQARAHGYSHIWAEAVDASGAYVSGTLSGPDGYSMTADASIRAVGAILDGVVRAGAWTPSQALGAEFVRELDGVTVHPMERGRRPVPPQVG